MIIAECCTNWAEIYQAKGMIRSAKENGAGLAKFQLFDASKERDSPWFDWLTTHELTFDQAKMLFDYGQEIGMEVFFSVFEAKYVRWCERIGVKRYKIAFSERFEQRLQEAVLRTGKRVIISSGYPQKGLDTLFCIPDYPASIDNLRGADFLHFSGFSDHTIGLDAAKIALARGAKIIEKHFVMEHGMDVPDAPWSMAPDELAELVRWEKVCREAI